MPTLHFLAYSLRASPVPQLGAWCPWCQRVHLHGDTGGQREPRGGGDHCQGHPFGNGYCLIRVGRLDLPSRIPKLTAAETLSFSQILERAFAPDNTQTRGKQ